MVELLASFNGLGSKTLTGQRASFIFPRKAAQNMFRICKMTIMIVRNPFAMGTLFDGCLFHPVDIYFYNSKAASPKRHLSHEKKPLTFHYTGCLIGILIMVYYNPHII